MSEAKIKTPCGKISWTKLLAAISVIFIIGGWFAWIIRTGDNSAKIPFIEERVTTMDKRISKLETGQEYQTKLIEAQSKQIDMAVRLLKKK